MGRQSLKVALTNVSPLPTPPKITREQEKLLQITDPNYSFSGVRLPRRPREATTSER